jgi:hypothetical protein
MAKLDKYERCLDLETAAKHLLEAVRFNDIKEAKEWLDILNLFCKKIIKKQKRGEII